MLLEKEAKPRSDECEKESSLIKKYKSMMNDSIFKIMHCVRSVRVESKEVSEKAHLLIAESSKLKVTNLSQITITP